MYTDTLPELAVPPAMTDETLERLLVLCELAWDGYTPFAFDVFQALEAYGQEGLALVGSIIRCQMAEMAAPDWEPSGEWHRARAAELVAQGSPDAAMYEMDQHRMEVARYHGRVALRCQGCGRYRQGTEWRRGAAPPADWLVMNDATCPDCDWNDGEDRLDPGAQEAAMYAWLAGAPADLIRRPK